MKSLVLFLTLLPFVANSAEEIPETEVDFSKAYVITKSTLPSELRIGGVETRTNKDLLIHSLRLGFNQKNASFRILEATPQTSDAQLLEQLLRGTTWTGNYKTNRNYYQTELYFDSVQHGYVGGEIYHTTTDPESPIFLRAKVAGNIVTQYLIEEENKEPRWVDADQIDYEALPPETIIPPVEVTRIRQIIRLKRIQAIEFEHNGGGWGTYNEYRFALVENELTGIVGTPTDRFGNSNAMTGVGEIRLKLKEEPAEEDLLPE